MQCAVRGSQRQGHYGSSRNPSKSVGQLASQMHRHDYMQEFSLGIRGADRPDHTWQSICRSFKGHIGGLDHIQHFAQEPHIESNQ